MTDAGEFCQKQSQWMSHWIKGTGSSEPQVGSRCNSTLVDAKYGTYTENCGSSNFEIMKSRLSERLMVGVSHERSSLEHGQQLNSNMWAVTRDVCQKSAQNKIDRDGSVQNSVMHKDATLYSKTVVSKSLSIQKLSELSLDFEKIASSDNLSSEWNHFPMFAINRKIDTILNPKRRPAKNAVPNVFVPQQTVKLNMTTSNVMAFSSQEYELHSHIPDEIMDPCKHARGIVSRQEGHVGLTSDPSDQKLKNHLSLEMACSCSKDGSNSSSDCPLDEQHTSHCFAVQEPTCRYGEKMFKSSENNDKNHKTGRSSQNQKSRTPGLHKQDDNRFCCPHESHGRIVASHVLSDEQQHLNTQRMVSSANATGSYVLPDPTANIFAVNSRTEVVTQASNIFAGSSKQKAPCLFEMITIPSKPQNTNPEYSLPSGSSTGIKVQMYGTNIGSHLFGANKSSVKTETLYSDTQHVSKSSAGISSLLAQKDHSCAKKAKSEQAATLSMKRASGCSKANGFQNVDEHQDVSSKAAIASKQQCCIPGTKSMNLGLVQFQMSRMRNQLSVGTSQSQARTDPGDRWLKRLQLDSKDPHLPSSKRPKVGDDCHPVAGPSSTHGDGMRTRCDRSDDAMADRVKEQALEQGMELQGARETSLVPAKSASRWIGRWCHGGVPPVFREDDPTDQRKKATKLDLAPGGLEVEGQFPSITAMAMMGRAMSKVRPCAQEKKDSCMVWKT